MISVHHILRGIRNGPALILVLLGISISPLCAEPSASTATTNSPPPSKPATQPTPKTTIAVLPFQNLKVDPAGNWIGRCAAEALCTKLLGVNALELVERNQIDKLQEEKDLLLEMNQAKAEAFVQAGRIINATRLVVGSYAVEQGAIQFNIRVIDTSTGVVLNGANITGYTNDIFGTIDQMVDAVVEAFSKRVVIVKGRPNVQNISHPRLTLTRKEKQRIRDIGKTGLWNHGTIADNIVYVLDRSGSMIASYDFVKIEAFRALGQLSEWQKFHFILMNTTTPIEVPSDRLMRASQTNKLAAYNVLKNSLPGGQTDPVPALARAFAVLKNAEGGKTIYLLSDGMYPDEDALLSLIRRENKDKSVAIFTYLFDERNPKAERLLKKIAADNNGKYLYVSPDE